MLKVFQDADILNPLSFIIFARIAEKLLAAQNRKNRWIKYEFEQFIYFQKEALEIT